MTAAGTEVGAGPPAGGTQAPMIVADRVSKWFGDLVAVSDVSFDVGPGVTALLGPNGAGKSTLLRLLSGQARPSQGRVTVLGADPRVDPTVRATIGLVPQQEAVFEALTPLAFVTLAARLRGVPAPESAAAQALERVDLDPGDTRLLPTYSKGMRQRVKIAQALVADPSIVLLDEPLTGLDPRQRSAMVELFHRLGAAGRCVLVSSHVLEEVERFGSNIVVVAKGRLAAQGEFRAIRSLMADRPLQVRVRATPVRTLASALVAEPSVVAVRLVDDETLLVDTADGRAFGRALAGLARQADASLTEVRPLDDDLESVFRYLVDR